MGKQTALKLCNDHLNYLAHLQQRQSDQSITRTLSNVINKQMDNDQEWQHLEYLRSIKNGK